MKKNILFCLTSAILVFCMALGCVSCGKEKDKDTDTISSIDKRSSRDMIQELVGCYGQYGDAADEQVEALLKELDAVDPAAAAKWTSILGLWRSVNSGLSLHYDVLPDGLSDTDELCIVGLGFQLNADGTMREELLERLKVVRNSAEKYPHAWIVCTGGPTASANASATEAGNMAMWLAANGIASERIIVEDQSLTTAQNALFTFDILAKQYPQITQLAIVSSDYHIATGVLLFGAESTLRAAQAGEEKVRVVSHAAYQAPSGTLSTAFQAGALIELWDDTGSC